jgi:hypothetical protein
MARIKLEDIFKQLGYEIKRSLSNTIKKEFPTLEFDQHKLYKEFVDNIGKETKKWEQVPDDAVEKGDY